MLFNSIQFLIFLPIVFILYWFVFKKNLRVQNFFLLVASYYFYGCWDWRFLFLIAFSSIIDYSVGIGLSKYDNPKIRKTLLFTSIAVNLGFLGFFKYFNFFVDNFINLLSTFGFRINNSVLFKIILPVGISFYTFQTLSYTIDVYKKEISPTKDFISFMAFVSFFPQLVAGPIERASNLLPQFEKEREFDYASSVNGLRQLLLDMITNVRNSTLKICEIDNQSNISLPMERNLMYDLTHLNSAGSNFITNEIVKRNDFHDKINNFFIINNGYYAWK